ncbi:MULTISPECIES: MFS transporter [Rahnella]|uniref:MFS transporter n=1 Tax=Rahnella laticis TaxID=2787622 RepID=A0ABS0EAL9_9GAMM|nr:MULTISPECIES: MFS transporter [Rahnella]MBF7982138.1 MFS transporter [Rahnella laticis]MBF8002228.1 MFS transporter [Rahnella sp. LAC-M12]
MSRESFEPHSNKGFLRVLLTLMLVIFSGFLIIGGALPVLPRYVHNVLGFGTFTVGLVTGFQFAASLASRFAAGRYADLRGGKKSIVLGLFLAIGGGMFYLISLLFITHPIAAISLILTGRAVIGAAESFIITGGMTLGLALTGEKQAGRVIAWVGTAMFVAFALGAPVGTYLYDKAGFLWIASATILLPFAALATVRILQDHVDPKASKGAITRTMKAVWVPGLGAALNGVGYAALLSFSVLMYANKGWGMGWLPVSAFATALIAARLLLGQLIDSLGSIRVGVIFSVITAAGQGLIGFAPNPLIAALGAAMTGAGWAMVYPAFGAEAVRRVGMANKGMAMAAYSAFPDFAIGLASPVLGLLVSPDKISIVFLWSMVLVSLAIPVALCSRGRLP